MPLMPGGGPHRHYSPRCKPSWTGSQGQPLGHQGSRQSASQRQKTLGWLSVSQEVTLTTMRMTHKVINMSIPEELATKMPLNTRNARLKEARKLDTKPRILNRNKWMQSSFRSCAYFYNTLPNRLTAISEPKHFNKWLNFFLKDHNKLPNPIPTQTTPNPTSSRRRRTKINGIGPVTAILTQPSPNPTRSRRRSPGAKWWPNKN